MWTCSECETKNNDSDRFCACCGAARPAAAAAAAPETGAAVSAGPRQAQAAPASSYTPNAGSSRPDAGFCPNCGHTVEATDTFCRNCGAKLTATAAAARPAASPPPPAPKEGKFKGILVVLVILALAYGGGRLLGGQMGRSSGDAVSPTPAAVDYEPVKTVQTQAPVQTPRPAATPQPAPSPQPAVWNYLEATDEEIWDLTAYFWGGTDPSTGARCVFFADQNAERGGYYWWISNDEGHRASFALGTFSLDSSGGDILVTPDEDIPLLVDNYGDGSDGSILFNFAPYDHIDGRMRLYWDDSLKETAIKYILAYKKFENSWRG